MRTNKTDFLLEDSRLQAELWTWRGRWSAATASQQRWHCLNLERLSHSPRRCSVRLAISTTCRQQSPVGCIWGSLKCRRRLEQRGIYLSAFIAAPQHRAVLPVVKVQTIFSEGLVLFTAEYAQAEGKKGRKVFKWTEARLWFKLSMTYLSK